MDGDFERVGARAERWLPEEEDLPVSGLVDLLYRSAQMVRLAVSSHVIPQSL
jgi:hypothetical protein